MSGIERVREEERERRERERESERERGREGGKERVGKHSACHVNVVLMLVRGALTPIFVRTVGVVATFLLLLSSLAQSVPAVRLMVEWFWSSQGVYLGQGT